MLRQDLVRTRRPLASIRMPYRLTIPQAAAWHSNDASTRLNSIGETLDHRNLAI